MSAFMVSKEHIDMLVRTAIQGPLNTRWTGCSFYHNRITYNVSAETADRIGQMLVTENLHSIHARYPDTITDRKATPGPIERYWQYPYAYTRDSFAHRATAIEAIKGIHCYAYQSCEHKEWESSAAKAFCDGLEHAIVQHMPGYDEAPWEWPAQEVTR